LTLAFLLTTAVTSAPAATFTVDTTTDAVDAVAGDGVCATAGGACSLRAAVQEANALAGADTIDLPAGTYVLTLGGGAEDAAASGDLDVTEPLTIDGAGAGVSIIDGNDASRVIEASAPITLSGVTIRHGHDTTGDDCDGPLFVFPGGDGVCVNGASLTLLDAVVEENNDEGVRIFGPLTVNRSTIRKNTSGFSGVGIAATTGATTIADSTISENGGAGVVFSVLGTALIRNTTISNNGNVGIAHGALCEPPQLPCYEGTPVTLNNVTITGHERAIYNVYQVVPFGPNGTVACHVANSILAGNGVECEGALVSDGYDLIQNAGPKCTVTGTTTGNITGLPAGLGPLANNGGPTATHALAGTSLAANAGNPAVPGSGGGACEATDQRGVVRPVGGRCDMGAYEGACGNGAPDAGEECDDGNATDGDGCQHNCSFAGCGNGIVEPGEQCDDLGTAAGDCCSPSCQLDPPGTACTGDGNVCTDDVCDGSGTCTHANNTAPCSDGSPCTLGDRCVNGTCTPEQFGCGPCLACTPGGCVPPPNTCTHADAARAKLTIRDEDDPANDRVAWAWKAAGPLSKPDFGDPTRADLGWRLCSYDAAGGAALLAVATERCDAVFGCWKETRNGFVYRQGDLIPGIVRAKLVAGTPARITVKARGTSYGVPPLPLALPVRVGLYHADSSFGTVDACWDAVYSAATRNDGHVLRATSD
jgi:CSLREA domain-containing protein